jgi:hypothetical protein
MHATINTFVSSYTIFKKIHINFWLRIWELLTPAYDYFSNINLTLLMKLISLDVRYFQACVFKIFEDANWEIR